MELEEKDHSIVVIKIGDALCDECYSHILNLYEENEKRKETRSLDNIDINSNKFLKHYNLKLKIKNKIISIKDNQLFLREEEGVFSSRLSNLNINSNKFTCICNLKYKIL